MAVSPLGSETMLLVDLGVFLLEAFDPSLGVHQFLGARKEGVTTGTYIDF